MLQSMGSKELDMADGLLTQRRIWIWFPSFPGPGFRDAEPSGFPPASSGVPESIAGSASPPLNSGLWGSILALYLLHPSLPTCS